MIIVGSSWLLFWLLTQVFSVELLKAALATAVVFILLGLVMGERPFNR